MTRGLKDQEENNKRNLCTLFFFLLSENQPHKIKVGVLCL